MEGTIQLGETAAADRPQARLYRWLAGRSDVLVLRPAADADDEALGDIDLLALDPAAAERELDRLFGTPDLRVARRFVIQRYYPWGQLDVLPALEWNGLPYADVERVFAAAARDPACVLRPRLGHDGYISWMTSLLWGGFFKERYADLIGRAARGDAAVFREALESGFGKAWADQLFQWAGAGAAAESANHVGALRRALAGRALAGGALPGVLAHWRRELAFHLRPPMPMVAVLGPDGAGKSTLIAELTRRLEARRISVVYCHWRPRLVGRGAEPGGGPVTDPHGKPTRSGLVSIVKLGLLAADWHLGGLGKLRHARAKAKLVFFDRYYDDLLIDPNRYRYGGRLEWARRVFRLLPRMHRVFVLWAPPEVILRRKREVAEDELARQIGAYRAHALALGGRARLIDVNRTMDAIADEVMEGISESLRTHGNR